MNLNLFESIFDKVNSALATYVTSNVTDIIHFIAPIFTSLIIIWIAIWGYMIMFGLTNEPMKEGVFRILRIGFIVALGLTIGNYMGIIVNVLSHGPEQIASAITGSTGGPGQSLDNLLDKIAAIAKTAWAKGGILNGNIGMYFIALAFLLVGCALLVAIAFLILLSKVMTAVLLAIGPIFIVLLLFKTTQRFFESWLGMVVNFGLILILSSAIGDLILSLAHSFVSNMGPNPSVIGDLGNATMFCVVMALFTLLMRQVPHMASALGGGVALAAQGALSSAVHSMRPTTIRRNARHIQRDARLAGRAAATPATAPYRGGRATIAAYRRFRGNRMTGS